MDPQVSVLDDVSKSSATDNNATKSIALDHLGVIAARIRSVTLKTRQQEVDEQLRSMDEVVSRVDVDGLDGLMLAHRDLASYLCKKAGEDQAFVVS